MTNLTPDPISPEHAALAARLAALGKEPVDPAIASEHLAAIAAVPASRTVRPVRERFVRGKIAAAFAAGLLLGGTSLASAGALGNTPQNAVADAAGHVGLDLPGGTPRSTEGCGGKTYKNHGEYVSQGGDPHSPCGKPVKSGHKPGKDKDAKDDANDGGTKKAGGAGDCGKPPWAGKGNHAKKTPEAVAQRKAACGDDESDDDSGAQNKAPKAGAPTTTTGSPSVTTTTAPATTTTAATSTTPTGVTTTTAPVTTTTAP
jgi:hypothetical protein